MSDFPHQPGRIRSNFPLVVAGGSAVMIGAIVVGVCYQEATATRAADAAAVVQPTRKPVEQAPPVAAIVSGDSTWIIGREIKRGTYRTEGGSSCYWARLANLSGELDAIIKSGYRRGPQVVALGPDDVAFASQGCEPWVMVR